jgi:DHA1 family tetracycline resistance protein-like MFS transporter
MGFAPNMAWLFVARMISGATAGALATCNAYIADVTPPEKRAQAFGLVGVAFGIGFVIGPAIGGLPRGSYSLRLPFFVAAACVGINWLYGAFVLPESLPPEHRRPFSWKRANPVGSLMALRRFRGVFDLAWMYFIFKFANTMLQSIWVLYTGYRYGWSAPGRPLAHLRRRDDGRGAGRPGQADHRLDGREEGARGSGSSYRRLRWSATARRPRAG